MSDTVASITGFDKFIAALRRLGAAAPQIAAGALHREAEKIMTDAKRRTPVDTGALRASGQVQPTAVSASGVVVTMGFGNSSVHYAIFVHENLHARHTVGEAKFLENAVNVARRGIDARLAADVRAQIERMAKA